MIDPMVLTSIETRLERVEDRQVKVVETLATLLEQNKNFDEKLDGLGDGLSAINKREDEARKARWKFVSGITVAALPGLLALLKSLI